MFIWHDKKISGSATWTIYTYYNNMCMMNGLYDITILTIGWVFIMCLLCSDFLLFI